MTSLIRRIFANSASISNVLYKSQSFSKCIRQMHLLTNRQTLIRSCLSTNNPCFPVSPVVYNSVRFKKNKRNSQEDDDEEEQKNEDSDAEDDSADLSDFREGYKSSDRNLAQVKVRTLRLDAVIKAGLGLSKR